MPLADGPEVMSKDPALAMKDARTLMDRLSKTLGEEENANVLQEVCEWLENWNAPVNSTKMASSSAALTEANVEARDFRLDFAQETLQSFKRDRSRSPRRSDDWDAKAAALQLDIANSRIDNLKGHIKNLEATVQTKDKLIADLEFRLALKEGMLEMMHELVNDHCRRITSQAACP
jgi:chromosome segregation ATPase